MSFSYVETRNCWDWLIVGDKPQCYSIPFHLKRITEEAKVQGGTLTQEDCADILNTNRSTIIRDIAVLKREGIEITTRAHYTDQGRGISHKER
jgi:biotin operon repressor